GICAAHRRKRTVCRRTSLRSSRRPGGDGQSARLALIGHSVRAAGGDLHPAGEKAPARHYGALVRKVGPGRTYYTVSVTRLICLLVALPLLAAPPARFAEHTIATGLTGGYQVVAADLNHDGRPDVIALASGLPELVWYENPTWERHVIAGKQAGMINSAVVGAD